MMTVTLARSISVTDKIRTRVFDVHVAWLTVMGGISSKKLSWLGTFIEGFIKC